MSEIQIVKRETRSIRWTMEQMKVGEFFKRPIEEENTVRPYASTLKRFTGKVYTVERSGDQLIVTRTE